ncbi:hypothetical protein QAD02_001564 [Eretmocerus hayati]|uniref:Uncharacterized protein n=1 Tax=Eretmocerus hayati TaxID=131215 RepID=A0ACC2NL68_9HYME|nr:hypothetical protein QAD02_001564 [Eretmocerus hayati]
MKPVWECGTMYLLFLVMLLSVENVELKEPEIDYYAMKRRYILGVVESMFPEVSPRNFHFSKNHGINSTLSNIECTTALNSVKEAIQSKRELWALKMLDASSKIPSGILKGNLVDLGMYDECIAISGAWSDIEIKGRHCMYSNSLTFDNVTFDLTLSVCVPDICSSDSVYDILDEAIKSVVKRLPIVEVQLNSVNCSPKKTTKWSTELIFWVVVLSIFSGFLVICTLCDEFHQIFDRHSKHQIVQGLRQFSLVKSSAKILSIETKEDNIPVIHGLRFLNTAWIVLGHEYFWQMESVNVNTLDQLTWLSSSWMLLLCYTCVFVVDTFLTITGFLTAYLFFTHIPKQKSFNIPMYLCHRFLRLTPSLLALIIFASVFVPKMGSGPRWHQMINVPMGSCRSEWWTILFFVQNFNPNSKCLPYLWYLAVDMQLFWISPFILLALYKKPQMGLLVISTLLFISLAYPGYIIAKNKYQFFSFLTTMSMDTTKIRGALYGIYVMPHFRASSWLIGILFGFFLVTRQPTLTKSFVRVGWASAFAAFCFCIFGTNYFLSPDYKYDALVETSFIMISKPVWALFNCWIIYTSIHGQAGLLSTILSWDLLFPLSKLSYCIYILHPIIGQMHIAKQRTPKYFSDFFAWSDYFGDYMTTVFVAFFFSLLFESPLVAVEKLLMERMDQSKRATSKSA